MCVPPPPSCAPARRHDAGVGELDKVLAAMEGDAEVFAWRFITDARARAAYVERIAAMSRQIREDVLRGAVSPAEGARFANQMRNTIMEETRRISSAIGRAGAEAAKSSGLTLEQALEKAVKKLFPGKAFAELSAVQKRQVFMEIIEASGRSNPRFTAQIPKWTRLGRGLIVVTLAISVYNIWAAENRLKQTAKEGATLLGGAAGGALATASAGLVCGPGAPVCVTALFIIGGIAGALAANAAAEALLDQKEIATWFGE